MLKRQRGSSPIPFPPEPTQQADVAPADLYEPDAKRRRYFAPVRAGDWREHDEDDSADAASSDGVRTPELQRRERGRGQEWLMDAGEYGKANKLLHNLHAEQRHRMLFAAPSQNAVPPPAYSDSYVESSSSYLHPHNTHLAKSEPSQTIEHPLRDYPSEYSSTKHGVDFQNTLVEERVASEEAAMVSQRYEDTNRTLRYLVLSRRNHLSQPPIP